MKASLSKVAADLGLSRTPAPPPQPATAPAPARKPPRPRKDAPPPRSRHAEGPRGGTTTVTPGGFYRTTAYFTQEERAALRKLARDQDRPYAEIIREAVRRYLGMS